MTTVVDEKAVYVADAGRGPAVLVLHGVPGSIESMAAVERHLAPRYRVLTPAMPGYRRTAVPSPRDTAETMRLVEAAVLARGIDEVYVVGFSAGGYRGLWLALHGRLKVRGVHLLGGYAAFTPEDAALAKALAGMIREMPDLTDPGFRQIAAQRMFSDAYANAHPDAYGDVDAWFDEVLSVESLADEFDSLATAPDLTASLPALEIPVVARVGGEDIASPVTYAEAVARGVPGGTVEVVPGAGHALLTEDTAATLASIENAVAAAYGR